MDVKIGIGYDVHKLKEGHDLFIGGMNIPHHKGSVGHSDGDVLIHAICDALLGALNLGDIGQHFPDTSPEFRGIDSKILLDRTANMMRNAGYQTGNLDCVVCLENPKIMPMIPEMREILARHLGTDPANVSVKATTTEKLGFMGREEGVAAYAVVLLQR